MGCWQAPLTPTLSPLGRGSHGPGGALHEERSSPQRESRHAGVLQEERSSLQMELRPRGACFAKNGPLLWGKRFSLAEGLGGLASRRGGDGAWGGGQSCVAREWKPW